MTDDEEDLWLMDDFGDADGDDILSSSSEEEQEQEKEKAHKSDGPPNILSTGRKIPGLCMLRDHATGKSHGRPFFYQEDLLEEILKRPKVICAADMGLGKTPTTLMLIAYLMRERMRKNPDNYYKTVIICPLMVKNVFIDEMVKHFEPGTFRTYNLTQKKRRTIDHHFQEAFTSPPNRRGYDVYILPYGWVKSKYRQATAILRKALGVAGGKGAGKGTLDTFITKVPDMKESSPSPGQLLSMMREIGTSMKQGSKAKRKVTSLSLWRGLSATERRRLLGGGVFSLFWHPIDMLVCDEAHEFNNRATQVYDSIDAILAKDRRLYLTGSPQENTPRNLRNLILSLTGPVLAADVHKEPTGSVQHAAALLLHNERNWDKAVDDSLKQLPTLPAAGLALLMERHVIRLSKNTFLRRSTCEKPNSAYQQALKQGRPVPQGLLEDILVKKRAGPFKTEVEVEVSNYLLAISHEYVQKWTNALQSGRLNAFSSSKADEDGEVLSGGRKAMTNPLTALSIMRRASFSPLMFDPVSVVRGRHLKADQFTVVSEEWTYDRGDGIVHAVDIGGGDDPLLSDTTVIHGHHLAYTVGDEIRRCTTNDLILTPAMILKARKYVSTKLRMIEDNVRQAVADGAKSVVFAQWLAEIGLVRDHLNATVFKDSTKYGIIAFGGHSEEERHDIVRTFRDDPNCCVLVANRVLGVGINISFARDMTFGTFGYNPWVERQAMDRLDRYGQKEQVNILYPVITDTVEDRVFSINRRKLVEATIMLDGHAEAENCALTEGIVDMAAWGIGSEVGTAEDRKKRKKRDALQLINAFSNTKALKFHEEDRDAPLFTKEEVFTDAEALAKKREDKDRKVETVADTLMHDLTQKRIQRHKKQQEEERKREERYDAHMRSLAEEKQSRMKDTSHKDVIHSIMEAIRVSEAEIDIPSLSDEQVRELGKRKATEHLGDAKEKKKRKMSPPPIPTKKPKKKKRPTPPPVPARPIDTPWQTSKPTVVPLPQKEKTRAWRKHMAICLDSEEDEIEDFSLEELITDEIGEFSDDPHPLDGYHSSSREASMYMDTMEIDSDGGEGGSEPLDTGWIPVV